MNQIKDDLAGDQIPSADSKDESADTKVETPATSATTPDIPEFGWSAYAERVNGRFAMIGFLSVLLIELFSKDSFLHWVGLLR